MTFFYKLIPNKIKELYLQFGKDWLVSMARISIESIKETSIEFESQEYFTKRNEINTKIKENLQKSFDQKAEESVTVGKHFNLSSLMLIESFELKSIDFDSGFENSVINKLKEKHFYNLYDIQGKVNTINAETYEESYKVYNELNITLAKAEAEAIKKDYEDKSSELKNYLNEMISAYDLLRSGLSETWANMTSLMVAIELKNNEYLSKNFVLLPDQVTSVIHFNTLSDLGSNQ